MSVDTLLTLVALGLTSGAAYALFALGYGLVYGVLGQINLAHGDVLVLASFATLGVYELGAPAAVAVAAGLVGGGAAGVVVDQVAYRPLRFLGDRLAPIVSALGAALVLRHVSGNVLGGDRAFPSLLGDAEVGLGSAGVPVAAVALLGLGTAVAVVIERLLRGTSAGAMVLAVAGDLTGARLVGLPVARVTALTYVLSGFVGGAGGILYASTFATAKVSLGFTATVVAFTAVVLAGGRSLVGAMAWGVVLGVVESLLGYVVPGSAREALLFALLAGALVSRPPVPGSLASPRPTRSQRLSTKEPM